MTTPVRLFVDSVLDDERLRILVSAGKRKPQDYVVTRSVLRSLLGIKRLTTQPEGRTYTFETTDHRGMTKFLKQSDLSSIEPTEIKARMASIEPTPQLGIHKVKDSTTGELEQIRSIHAKLRKKMEERDK
jgi:hypothetical protein